MSTWRELTFPTNTLKKTVIVIEDDRANILADPLRWLILETLGEGKSVAEISQTLEITDARVLYHLKKLAQIGVVHLQKDETGPPGMVLFASSGQDSRSRGPPGKQPGCRGHANQCCQPVQSSISRSSPRACTVRHSRHQSITTAHGYLKNRHPNLVVDYWHL